MTYDQFSAHAKCRSAVFRASFSRLAAELVAHICRPSRRPFARFERRSVSGRLSGPCFLGPARRGGHERRRPRAVGTGSGPLPPPPETRQIRGRPGWPPRPAVAGQTADTGGVCVMVRIRLSPLGNTSPVPMVAECCMNQERGVVKMDQ